MFIVYTLYQIYTYDDITAFLTNDIFEKKIKINIFVNSEKENGYFLKILKKIGVEFKQAEIWAYINCTVDPIPDPNLKVEINRIRELQ